MLATFNFLGNGRWGTGRISLTKILQILILFNAIERELFIVLPLVNYWLKKERLDLRLSQKNFPGKIVVPFFILYFCYVLDSEESKAIFEKSGRAYKYEVFQHPKVAPDVSVTPAGLLRGVKNIFHVNIPSKDPVNLLW